jgi:Glycosyl transferase family 2
VRLDDALGLMWRTHADLRRWVSRRGGAGPALEVIGTSDRSDLDRWNAATDAARDAYRTAVAPATGSLAVVCVSNRPWQLTNVLANVRRQRHPVPEFLLVLNTDEVVLSQLSEAMAVLDDDGVRWSLLSRSSDISLGHCLNAALAHTDARYIAKFDDDDVYGPEFIADSMRAHAYAAAGVVGKHSYYAHLVESDELVLRFPTHEFSYSSTLAGGTLVIDRDRVGDQRFADISLGEDRAFIRQCLRRGISTFSADRFGYVQTRSGDNTWSITRDEFLEKSVVVDEGSAIASALERVLH